MPGSKRTPMSKIDKITRLLKAARKEQSKEIHPTKEFRQHHTRATFGHRYTGRMVPLNLDESPESVPYNPGWEPPLRTMEPNFKETNAVHYWVILRWKNGHSKVIRSDFKILCKEGKTCNRKGCASCWVAFKFKIPKEAEIIIREVPSGERIKINDPAGVDTHGFRAQGKSLGIKEREIYKLTSTQKRYKGEAGSQ